MAARKTQDLPDDVILIVAARLPVTDLLTLRRLSKSWNHLITGTPRLWKRISFEGTPVPALKSLAAWDVAQLLEYSRLESGEYGLEALLFPALYGKYCDSLHLSGQWEDLRSAVMKCHRLTDLQLWVSDVRDVLSINALLKGSMQAQAEVALQIDTLKYMDGRDDAFYTHLAGVQADIDATDVRVRLSGIKIVGNPQEGYDPYEDLEDYIPIPMRWMDLTRLWPVLASPTMSKIRLVEMEFCSLDDSLELFCASLPRALHTLRLRNCSFSRPRNCSLSPPDAARLSAVLDDLLQLRCLDLRGFENRDERLSESVLQLVSKVWEHPSLEFFNGIPFRGLGRGTVSELDFNHLIPDEAGYHMINLIVAARSQCEPSRGTHALKLLRVSPPGFTDERLESLRPLLSPSLHTLELACSQLSSAGLTRLLTGVTKLRSLRTLALNGANITGDPAVRLAEYLAAQPTLQYFGRLPVGELRCGALSELELRETETETGAHLLGLLATPGASPSAMALTRLKLHGSLDEIRLRRLLPCFQTSLQDLSLDATALPSPSVHLLATLLPALASLRDLTIAVSPSKDSADPGAEATARLVERIVAHSSLQRFNQIPMAGLRAGILPKVQLSGRHGTDKLGALVLGARPTPTPPPSSQDAACVSGASRLPTIAPSYSDGWMLRHVAELRLNDYRLEDSGVQALCGALPATLRALTLAKCGLTSFAVNLVADALSRLPALCDLDLRGNPEAAAASTLRLADATAAHLALQRLGGFSLAALREGTLRSLRLLAPTPTGDSSRTRRGRLLPDDAPHASELRLQLQLLVAVGEREPAACASLRVLEARYPSNMVTGVDRCGGGLLARFVALVGTGMPALERFNALPLGALKRGEVTRLRLGSDPVSSAEVHLLGLLIDRGLLPRGSTGGLRLRAAQLHLGKMAFDEIEAPVLALLRGVAHVDLSFGGESGDLWPPVALLARCCGADLRSLRLVRCAPPGHWGDEVVDQLTEGLPGLPALRTLDLVLRPYIAGPRGMTAPCVGHNTTRSRAGIAQLVEAALRHPSLETLNRIPLRRLHAGAACRLDLVADHTDALGAAVLDALAAQPQPPAPDASAALHPQPHRHISLPCNSIQLLAWNPHIIPLLCHVDMSGIPLFSLDRLFTPELPKNLQSLRLVNCQLEPGELVDEVTWMLPRLPTLRLLDLSRNPRVTNQIAAKLGRAAAEHPALEWFSCLPAGALRRGEVRRLRVKCPKFGEPGAHLLAHLAPLRAAPAKNGAGSDGTSDGAAPPSAPLTEVELVRHRMSNETVRVLCNALPRQLRSLKLHRCGVRSTGADHLAAALPALEALETLEVLDCRDCGAVGPSAARLAEAVLSHPALQHFNRIPVGSLRQTRDSQLPVRVRVKGVPVGEAGAHVLAGFVDRGRFPLIKLCGLSLDRCGLGDGGARVLAEALGAGLATGALESLVHLSLAWNSFSAAAVERVRAVAGPAGGAAEGPGEVPREVQLQGNLIRDLPLANPPRLIHTVPGLRVVIMQPCTILVAIGGDEFTEWMTGHRAEITCMAVAPDGCTLYTGSADCTVHVWDLTSLQEAHAERARSREKCGLSYEALNLKMLRQMPLLEDIKDDYRFLSSAITKRFHVQGRWLRIVLTDGVAEVVDLLSGETVWPAVAPMRVVYAHSLAVLDAVMSPDGHSLVTASADGTLKVWACASIRARAVASGARQGIPTAELRERVWQAKRVSVEAATDGGAHPLFQEGSFEFQHRGKSLRVEMVEGDTYVVDESGVRLWPDPPEHTLQAGGGAVERCSFVSVQGLVSGHTDGRFVFWGLPLSTGVAPLLVKTAAADPVVGGVSPNDASKWGIVLTHSPCGRFTVCGGGGLESSMPLWVVDVQMVAVRELRGSGGLRAGSGCAFSADRRWLAVWCGDERVMLWSTVKDQIGLWRRVARLKHNGMVRCCKFHGDGSGSDRGYLMAVSDRGYQTWDLGSGMDNRGDAVS
ncbi:hypothetical protein CYMTET_52680 [Cymbomonas tetramitiformis]|uniref:F-box domain-containing protein n=1 Tax=Cymbomonas tetramitiformis TaxID=36881 RepID=A0AAE0ERE1_9CHLO|nr:hypothetical protein CYMTET_52680 [Cymbomonas tetramitiformis]